MLWVNPISELCSVTTLLLGDIIDFTDCNNINDVNIASGMNILRVIFDSFNEARVFFNTLWVLLYFIENVRWNGEWELIDNSTDFVPTFLYSYS